MIRTQVPAWLLGAFALAAPVAAWLVSIGQPLDYLGHALPPGQALYLLAKLAGLLGFALFWLQGMFALLRGSPGFVDLAAPGGRAHRRLGLLTLAVVLAHFVLFLAAASLRGDAIAWDLLLPDFSHGHYRTYLSVGIVALWALLLGVYAGWRTSRGGRQWRVLHAIWMLVFVLGFLHAFAIGSESRLGVMRAVFLLMAAGMVVAIAVRVRRGRGSRRPAGAFAPMTSTGSEP